MPIKAVITQEEYEALDEARQEEYSASQDGRYYADLEDVDDHPSVQGLRNALDRWKRVAGSSDPRSLKKRLDEATSIRESFGELDPEEAHRAIERLEELESGEGDKDRKAEIERIREGLESKYSKQIEEKDVVINRLTASVEDREVNQALDSAIGSLPLLEGVQKGVKHLLLAKGPKVVWEEGEPRGVFTGELGDEIDVATFVEAWSKTDEAKAYMRPSGNNGSGASGNRGGGGGSRGDNPWHPDTRNLTEQGKIQRENPALAKQLKAAAGAR